MFRLLSNFIFKTILGWKLIGSITPETKKCIIIGAPHTSYQDFFIAVLFRSIVNLPMKCIVKKSFFNIPLVGFLLKLIGGVPVDRNKSSNFVDAVVDVFNAKDEFRLAISPEGTRKKVKKWKTGFYYIAKGANVPIVMMTFDFGNKQIKVSDPYFTTENEEADFAHFYNFYKNVIGKHPELS